MAATLLAADPIPEDNDVVAGWTGFIVFIAMVVAVVILIVSLRRQFRKVDRARDAGVFGETAPDVPAEPAAAGQEE